MFEEIIEDLSKNKEGYSKLEKNFTKTPLENSLDIIIDQINLDVVKILKYNRI
jgi:hypothetical protein